MANTTQPPQQLVLDLMVEVKEENGRWSAWAKDLGIFVQAKSEEAVLEELHETVVLACNVLGDPETLGNYLSARHIGHTFVSDGEPKTYYLTSRRLEVALAPAIT